MGWKPPNLPLIRTKLIYHGGRLFLGYIEGKKCDLDRSILPVRYRIPTYGARPRTFGVLEVSERCIILVEDGD